MAPLATVQTLVRRRLDTPNFARMGHRAAFEMNDGNDCASVNRIGMPYTKTLRGGNLNFYLADGLLCNLNDLCAQHRDVYPYRSRDLTCDLRN